MTMQNYTKVPDDTTTSEVSPSISELDVKFNATTDSLDVIHNQIKQEMDDIRDTIRTNRLINTRDYYRIDLDLVRVKRNWNLVVSSIWSIVTTIFYLILIIMVKESILMKPLAITFGVIVLCALALIYITYKRRDTVLKYEAEQDFKYLEKAENKLKQLGKKTSQ